MGQIIAVLVMKYLISLTVVIGVLWGAITIQNAMVGSTVKSMVKPSCLKE